MSFLYGRQYEIYDNFRITIRDYCRLLVFFARINDGINVKIYIIFTIARKWSFFTVYVKSKGGGEEIILIVKYVNATKRFELKVVNIVL